MIEEAEVESTFELEVVLRCPKREDARGYDSRVTLAKLEVPVTGERGWTIYQYATRLAVAGEGQTTFAFAGAAAEELRVQ